MGVKLNSFTSTRIAAILFAVAATMASCVDDSYDLSNLDGENAGIGTSESSFDMPLITMNIDASKEISSSSTTISLTKSDDDEGDIFSNLEAVNALLPDTYADGIDLTQTDNDTYLAEIVDALFIQIQDDLDKCTLFFNEVKSNEDYLVLKIQIKNELGINLDTDSASALQTEFKKDVENAVAIANLKLTVIDLIKQTILNAIIQRIEAGEIEVGGDALDIITKNLDGENDSLRLIATCTTSLNIEIEFMVTIIYNNNQEFYVPNYVDIDMSDTLGNDGLIDDENLLNEILSDFNIDLKIGIKNYDPSTPIDTDGHTITINIIARKTGSISL